MWNLNIPVFTVQGSSVCHRTWAEREKKHSSLCKSGHISVLPEWSPTPLQSSYISAWPVQAGCPAPQSLNFAIKSDRERETERPRCCSWSPAPCQEMDLNNWHAGKQTDRVTDRPQILVSPSCPTLFSPPRNTTLILTPPQTPRARNMRKEESLQKDSDGKSKH